MTSPAPPEQTSGEQRIVRLLKTMFRLYAEHKDLDTEELRSVTMQDFTEWTQAYPDRWCAGQARDELISKLGILETDIYTVDRVLSSPWTAVQLLQPLWPMLALSGQAPIRHLPEFVHVAVTFAFDPGSINEKGLQLQAGHRLDLSSAMTDGFLCALLKDMADGLLQTIAGNGVDALYSKYAQPIGEVNAGKVPPTARGSG